MLAHYAANTLALVRRSPLAAAIRVLTLAVGLACFIAAHAITGFWQRSERHFESVDRIFSVSTDLAFRDGSLATGELPLTNEHVAAYLEADYPGLTAVARARVIGEAAMVSADDRAVRLFRVDVDPEFLEIFDLPFIAGDSRRALREPGSVVLTEEAAVRLFGEKRALGRRLRLSNSVDAVVTGVIAAIPEPSHMGRSATASLRFDLLASRDLSQPPPPATGDAHAAPENWLILDTATYVLLPADGSLTASRLDNELAAFAGRHVPREQIAFAQLEFGLVPVAELLVRSGSSGVFLSRTGLTVTAALSLLGALMLAVACANYGNLAAVTALTRSREVAVRKALGATPLQIAGQYLLDASVFTCAGLIAALAAVLVTAPILETAIGIDLRIALLDGASLAFLAALLPIVSVLGGLYPALVLARQRSVAPSRGARERRASNVLVAAQFTASSFLLLAAMVTYLQNAAMQRSLRAAPHPLVIIENFYTATRLHPDTLRRELAALAHSSGVTDMARPPWTGVNVLPLGTSPADAAVQRSAIWHTVGRDFFATFGIRLLAGRVFDGAHGDDALTFLGDSRRPNNIVIDRTLAQELGFPSAEAAVGGIVYVPRELMAGFGGSGAQPLRVIGVVADRPLTLAGGGARGSVYSFADPLPFQVVRIARTHVAEALAEIDALWKRLAPSVALRRRFEDEIFAEKYAGHEQVNRALAALALFAFAISAIGLFSMAKVAARRRLREIAVRKVLGATTTAVTMLMLASFARPIIVANVVAWPAGYFAARAYLAGFVAPVPLTVFPFVLCLAMTVLVVGATVFSQTLRVARIKPCAALRHE